MKSVFNFRLNSKGTAVFLAVFFVGALLLIGNEYWAYKVEMDQLLGGVVMVSSENSTNEEAFYIINKGDDKAVSYQVTVAPGANVFSLLEDLAQKQGFKIESTLYQDMGILIESIDGVKNGANNRYWQYWVNGELPMVAADKKEIKPNDVVEWRFEEISF